MSLQDLFYIVGLVYMSLGIILLIALVIAVFLVKKKINDMQRLFDQKLHFIEKMAQRPAESAVDIGASLAEAAMDKIKSAFEGNSRRKKTS